MRTFDIRKFHKLTQMQLPNVDLKSKYTFYYDETNNIRKFYVKEQDFNASFNLTFVLGGLLHSNRTTPEIEILFEGIRLQKSTTETKLKHLATGDFLECLTSDKLSLFLTNLLKSKFYVH